MRKDFPTLTSWLVDHPGVTKFMRNAMGVPRHVSVKGSKSELGHAGGTQDSDNARDDPRVSGMVEVASSADLHEYLEEDLLTALAQVSTRQRPLPRPTAINSENKTHEL